MDKGSATAEQNKTSSRVSTKRKRASSYESSVNIATADTGELVSGTSADITSGGATDSAPKSKRVRRTVRNRSTATGGDQGSREATSSTNQDEQITDDDISSIDGADRFRGLTDLVDYFPSFQLGRRLTRSLARQLGAASTSPPPSNSRATGGKEKGSVGEGGTVTRRNSLPAVTAKAASRADGRSASSVVATTSLASSSSSAVKTGCHLSRKTHPSAGTPSTSGSGGTNAKVTSSSSGIDLSETGKTKEKEIGNAQDSMEQEQKSSTSSGSTSKKGSGRVHSSHAPSTAPKHGHGGAYRMSGAGNALVDLERDGGSSSSESMDGSSGISSTGMTVAGGAASGGGSNAGSSGSGRLHTLLDARNLPMHIFGALGPRMQTLFNRCPSHGSGNGGNSGGMPNSASACGGGGGRFDPLIQGMQKADDPSAQLQSLIELCNILVMSNEETLGANFPVKDTIRCLIKLLQSEQSYDIMTHACRALTYLMEAAPRVTPAVTDSVPLLLDKLQRVECIDVAEQALAALDLLSRRHSKCILMAGGIGACLQYIDFFSLASQRSALQIVANCCLHMTSDDFHFLVDSLPALTQRLNATDKKTVELVCVLFTRLVDNYVHEPEKMRRLCDYGLLENVQQMIVASPPVLSSSVLVSVIRMMHTLCRQCSELAVRLLRLNVVATIRFLLMGTADAVTAADAELLARTPQELYELVLLISELLPPLPNDGPLFEVDTWLKACYYYFYQGGRCVYSSLSSSPSHASVPDGGAGAGASAGADHTYWAWKDERGLWRPFTHSDNQLLETAYQARDEEVSLNTFGQQYTIDMVNMIQINDDTGYSRPIQRKVAGLFAGSRAISAKVVAPAVDPRLELIRIEPKLHEELVRCLLPVLYDIYTSVGGPAVRHECLRGMLRMIYHSDSEVLLRESLKKEAVSSLLAGMLNSNDVKTIIPALQLATVLMEKLPDVFHVHFRREGVTHQLRRLATEAVQFTPSVTSSTALTSSTSASVDALFSTGTSSSSLNFGSSAPSSNSVAGLHGLPPNFLDRTSGRDVEGVGLNAINSVDQFLSAVSGLPVLRHHRHVHHRQQTFDSSSNQQKSSFSDYGSSARFVSASTVTGSNEAMSVESVSSIPTSAVLPPSAPFSGSTGAFSSNTSGDGAGAVPKRHHHSHAGGSSSGCASGPAAKAVASGGNIKTRRAAAAAAIAKQSSSGRGSGTRSSRMRTSSAEVSNSQPQLSSLSTLAASSETGPNQGAGQTSAASSFFQNLPFPKWARTSGGTGATSTSSAGASHRQGNAATAAAKSVVQHLRQKHLMAPSSSSGDHLNTHGVSTSVTSVTSASSLSVNAEKCLNWVREQAKAMMAKYFSDGGSEDSSFSGHSGVISSAAQHAASVLERLSTLATCLRDGKTDAIYELADIISSPSNVSCFELLQSGLVLAMTEFLVGGQEKCDDRLRAFCKAFFGVQYQMGIDEDGVPFVVIDHHRETSDNESGWLHPARLLLSKLNVCVSQLEQFPVKVHDFAGASSAASGGLVSISGAGGGGYAVVGGPGGGGPFGLISHLSGMAGSPASLRGLSALRFLHSQQIKCHLQRHPEEKRLKQWHRGPIKIDPLAQIVTIEKYLLTKGFGRRCNSSNEDVSGDDDESTDDDEDEDGDENSALFLGELSEGNHRLQILINDKVLPYDMTIYQAVRQYGLRASAYVVGGDGFGTASAHGTAGSFASEWIGPEVWIHTHVLTYRLAPDAMNKQNQTTSASTGIQQVGSASAGTSGNAGKATGSGRSKFGSKTDKSMAMSGGGDGSSSKSSLASMDLALQEAPNPLSVYLLAHLPTASGVDTVTAGQQAAASASTSTRSQQQPIQDPSLECINLIRILFGISRYWWTLYKDAIVTNFQPGLSLSEFQNTKLAAKVSRQLQDPLTVVAGQLPNWIEQLTNTCPFLFPFEVRQAVFHVVALDRDRALQRLLDSSTEGGGGGGGGGSSERITPRLERRKVLVNRDELLKQTETVLGTMDNSRAILEIQYENEVGTGLGPTLEFYALVSRQFQRADLQLWRGIGEESQTVKPDADKGGSISAAAKVLSNGGLCPSPLGRHVKSNMLEKMLAKFRLLGKFLGRSLLDGRILDLPLSTVFYKWLIKDEQTLSWADLADLDPTLYRSIQYLRRQQLKAVSLNNPAKQEDARCAIEAMELDFTVPGYPSLELVKNGKDKLVTLDNLQQYLDLLLHWLLKAGICRQMDAVRDSLNALIPLKHLRLFFPEELDQLFCGARLEPDLWDRAVLLQALRPDHGYNHDSQPVRWLVEILAVRFDDEQRRQFIQFITGSPRLPVGGLKNLNPPLTVVRKSDAANADAQLPSVMTCVNYLKLPEYSSMEVMEQRLLTAITHGRYSFHLS